jgi:2-dehydropantoate 2-reductase
LGEINAVPAIVDAVRRMMQEADAVASALGAPPPADMSVATRIGYAAGAPGQRMSMLQDMDRGRPLEYEVILDSIRTMRDIAQLPTPTIDLIHGLFKLRVAHLPSN